jgi:predicted transcriptional regulator
LYRLVSAHRLRRLGLTFNQIATELGITSRHARRLTAVSVFLALRRELVRRDKTEERADLVAARRTARESVDMRPRGRRRAWPAPRRA